MKLRTNYFGKYYRGFVVIVSLIFPAKSEPPKKPPKPEIQQDVDMNIPEEKGQNVDYHDYFEPGDREGSGSSAG